MKFNKTIICAVAAAVSLGLTACDDDDIEVTEYAAPVTVTASPLADVQNLNPRTVDALTLEFSVPIKVANLSKITLNDVVPAESSVSVSDNVLSIGVTLEPYTTYTLKLYPFSIQHAETNGFIEEPYTMTFTTGTAFTTDALAKTLVNPSATAEAKKVYDMLLANYGKKQLSGAMGAIAWATDYCDYIQSVTGEYPAIVGFDYIFLRESVTGENWIDYADITPVKQAWEAGSIPAFSWHWRVPVIDQADADAPQPTFENEVWKGTFDFNNWGGWLDLPTADWTDELKAGEYLVFVVKDGATGAIGICDDTWTKVLGVDYYETTGNLAIELTQEFIDAIKATPTLHLGGTVTITSIVHTDAPALTPKVNYEYKTKAFSPKAALTEGTEENAIINADIASVAGYLKLLQDAGIPVLWRPLHEAAGDYSNGAWFWWGNDGVEVTKQLWVYLYDKLVNEYGLNNLIWVWTMQTTDKGDLAATSLLQEAYPGDQYVDIVGVDVYKDEIFADVSSEFNLVVNATGSKKMLALSEVGNLVDVDKSLATETLWSFFMNWYDQDEDGRFVFSQWNNKTTWRAVLSNETVLNRGDLW